MTWLQSFYLNHPEYRKLRVARRSPYSIHFELEPRRNGRGGLYEAHLQVKPIYARAGRAWMPPEFSALGRLIDASIRNPRAALGMALALPFATVLTSQPDATAGLDTKLESWAPNTNNGTATTLSVGDNFAAERSLIKFSDISTIPSSAVISSAVFSLFLQTNSNTTNGMTLSVYRQKLAWTEAGATWNKYDGTHAWQTAGGFGANDCEQVAIGSIVLANNEGTLAFKNIALTPVTVAALDLGNGWLFKAETESLNLKFFSSSDHATAARHPTLVITYTLPAGGVFNPPFSSALRGPFG